MALPPAPRHDVLVVDDNDDVREAFVLVLRMEGYEVASAWGVEDALRQLREGLRPCVVLLDLHMPGLNGWALVDHLTKTTGEGEVPIVIVSGDATERTEAVQRSYPFLLKPVEGPTLVAAVERHCTRAPSAP